MIVQLLAKKIDAATPAERSYCKGAVEQDLQSMTRLLLRLGLAAQAVTLLIELWVVMEDDVRLLLRGLHFGLAVVLVALMVMLPRAPLAVRVAAFLAGSVQLLAFVLIARIGVEQLGYVLPVTAAAYLALALGTVATCPLNGVFPAVHVVTAIAGAWILIRGVPHGNSFIATTAAASIFALVTRVVRMRLRLAWSLLELRTNLLVAPAAIVLRAPLGDVESAFRPSRRPCACVSIKWRGVDWSAGAEGASIASMEAHFAACEQILDELVPGGGYFCDALTDELFVVIFDTESGEPAASNALNLNAGGDARLNVVDAPGGDARLNVVDAAFTLCSRLLARREAALLRHLDAGVAFGSTLVGIMGPQAHRKTTGLGEVPGRAARLAAAGTELRGILGDADRVILDVEAAAALAAPADLSSFAFGRGGGVRDIGNAPLFYASTSKREAA